MSKINLIKILQCDLCGTIFKLDLSNQEKKEKIVYKILQYYINPYHIYGNNESNNINNSINDLGDICPKCNKEIQKFINNKLNLKKKIEKIKYVCNY